MILLSLSHSALGVTGRSPSGDRDEFITKIVLRSRWGWRTPGVLRAGSIEKIPQLQRPGWRGVTGGNGNDGLEGGGRNLYTTTHRERRATTGVIPDSSSQRVEQHISINPIWCSG